MGNGATDDGRSIRHRACIVCQRPPCRQSRNLGRIGLDNRAIYGSTVRALLIPGVSSAIRKLTPRFQIRRVSGGIYFEQPFRGLTVRTEPRRSLCERRPGSSAVLGATPIRCNSR